jgi:hypothetical protein
MRIKSLLLIVLFSAVSVACAKPVIVSGQDLPPDKQATLSSGSGITINEIDEIPLDGRRFILAPGTYSIDVTSKRDLKDSNLMFKGVISQLDCKIEVELKPGEELMISSRIRTGKTTYSGGNPLVGYSTEITASSSLGDDRSQSVPAISCNRTTDCSKLDRFMVKGGSEVCD